MRILILLVLGLMALPCLSQTTIEVPNNDGLPTTDEALGNMDFTEVTTGILLDKALQLERTSDFDGNAFTQDNLMTIDRYGRLYATINHGVVKKDAFLPDPATTYMGAWENLTDADPIPIAFLELNYEKFKPDAVANNLISESNSLFYDVPNRPVSPYEMQSLFVGSAVINELNQSSVEFVIPSNLYISNTGGAISSISVNFGNGSGSQTVLFDVPVSVEYNEAGQQNVEITVNFVGGGRKKTHFLVDIGENAFADSRYAGAPNSVSIVTANPIDDIDADGDGVLDGVFNSATISVFTHCASDALIRKPLIYIEGYDSKAQKNKTFEHIFDKLIDFNLTFDGQPLSTHLDISEYDIIFVDFTDGDDFIQRNAMVIKELIRVVNAAKKINGSSAPNVVIGNSMGGLAGKYALLDMEQDGEDHETEKLITHDSPFVGSNIPASAQALVDQVVNLPIPCGFSVGIQFPPVQIEHCPLKTFVPKLRKAEEDFESPGAQQMLVYNRFRNSNWRQEFYDDLNGRGEGQFFEHIAIVNGAIAGSESVRSQIVNPEQLMVHLGINLGGISSLLPNPNVVEKVISSSLFLLLGIQARVDVDLYALPDEATSYKNLYKGYIKVKVLHIFTAKSHKHIRVKGFKAYDSAPGGMLGFELNPLIEFLDPFFVSYDLDVNVNSFCHSLAVGASGLKAPQNEDLLFDLSNPNQLVADGLTVVDRYVGADADAEWYGIVQRNSPHVSFSATNAALFLSELAHGFPLTVGLDGVLDRTYNFGISNTAPTLTAPVIKTSSTLNKSLTISGNGKLWANGIEKIGFTDISTNPDNQTPTHFDLHIATSCDGQTVVQIVNGGEFTIGDWTGSSGNTANVYAGNNTSIIIGNNGLLQIDDNSKLIIQSGAEVTVEAGGILNPTWHSQVIVEAGGILRIESGGMLRPMHSSQVWVQPGGQLLLDDGAKVQLWDGTTEDAACNIKLGEFLIGSGDTPEAAKLVLNGEFEYSGTGYFDIHPHASIELLGDTNFKIDGYGKGYRFLKLSSGGSLRLDKNQCQLRNGEVEYAGSGTIKLIGTASGRFFQTEFTRHSEIRKAPMLPLNLKYFANQRFV